MVLDAQVPSQGRDLEVSGVEVHQHTSIKPGKERLPETAGEIPQQIGAPEDLHEPGAADAVYPLRLEVLFVVPVDEEDRTPIAEAPGPEAPEEDPDERFVLVARAAWPRSPRPSKYWRKQAQCPPPCGYRARPPARTSLSLDAAVARAPPPVTGGRLA